MSNKGPQHTLNNMARDYVGDGRKPNHYFVTDGSDVVMVSQDGPSAYRRWRELASRRPLQECALDDRLVGVLASVEPSEENKTKLVVIDDSGMDRTLRGV